MATTRIQLPARGNYDFLELPAPVQALIEAAYHLEEAVAQLDIAETRVRHLDASANASERAEWRWHQSASVAAWTLYEEVLQRAQLGVALHRAAQQAEQLAAQAQKAQAERATLAQDM